MTVSITGKTYTFSNGNANDASEVEAEVTSLHNNDAALKTKVDSLLSGAIEDSATLTINSLKTGSPSQNGIIQIERGSSPNVAHRWNETDDQWEVTRDGTNYYPVQLVVSSDPSSPAAGWIWYNTADNQFKYYDGSSTLVISSTTPVYPYPHEYQGTAVPVWASGTTITIAHIACRDSTDAYNLEKTTSSTINSATTGALGLDAGVLANNTWYFFYAIGKTDGTTSVLFSAVNELVTGSITQPSGYTLKRQLPFAMKTDGSGNFYEFYVSGGWPRRPEVWFNLAPSYFNGSTVTGGATNVLTTGSATSFTAINCASFQPAISEQVILHCRKEGTFLGTIRESGSSANGNVEVGSAASANEAIGVFRLPTASQAVDYKRFFGTGTLSVDVMGFIVTELD